MDLPCLSPRITLRIGSKYMKTASHPSSTSRKIISTKLFRGKIHSAWFHEVEILQGRWQYEEEVGNWYTSGLDKTVGGTSVTYRAGLWVGRAGHLPRGLTSRGRRKGSHRPAKR
jgi:hypothetical protein